MFRLLAVFRSAVPTIIIAIGLSSWMTAARVVRAEVLRTVNLEYVMAARALGASHLRIIFRHILPGALAPVLVSVSFGIAGAILLESSLSFLGIGIDPTTPTWGRVLQEGFETWRWWLIVFPGLAIFIAVFVYNLAGDAFQEAADPRRSLR